MADLGLVQVDGDHISNQVHVPDGDGGRLARASLHELKLDARRLDEVEDTHADLGDGQPLDARRLPE
eukprot:2602226-Prymnesium_polylepis.1